MTLALARFLGMSHFTSFHVHVLKKVTLNKILKNDQIFTKPWQITSLYLAGRPKSLVLSVALLPCQKVNRQA